jgi:hypothetical protein
MKPLDKSLYKYVKNLSDNIVHMEQSLKKKWIIKKYKSLGGRFKKRSSISFFKNKEKWVVPNMSNIPNTVSKKKQVSFKTPLIVQHGSGIGKSQYYGKKSKIMIRVPQNVKKAALYAFKLQKIGFKGGLETGWKRAKQLATQTKIPIQDLKYMRAWYARHIYASYPTYKKWKNAGMPHTSEWFNKHGIISWLIWGGSPGFKWVNSQKNINLLNNFYNKEYKAISLKKK